jgi:AraC family transcriptional activator of pobA
METIGITFKEATINSKEFFIEEIGIKPFYSELQQQQANYWRIFLIAEGGGNCIVDFETVSILDNRILFIAPNHTHKLPITETTKGILLTLSEDFFYLCEESHDFMLKLMNNQLHHKNSPINFTSEEFNDLLEIVNKMQKESSALGAENRLVLKNYFSIFLCKCKKNLASAITTNSNNYNLTLVVSFMQQVEENFRAKTKVKDYLSLLGVTNKKLCSLCKFYLGTSPTNFIQKRILNEAKRLLLLGNVCHKEIAYQLNFTDPSHFTKFFKRNSQFCPKQFQKKSLENNVLVNLEGLL